MGKGDRVVGYIPNCPEAIEAMAATAAIGAIWSSTSPDFGVSGVLDRFSQIQPKVRFPYPHPPYRIPVLRSQNYLFPAPAAAINSHLKMYYYSKKYVSVEVEIVFLHPSILHSIKY